MQIDSSEMSLKNTKSEILEAYKQLLEEFKQKQQIVPVKPSKKDELEKREEQNLVEKASQYTMEHVLKNAAELKLNMTSAIDQLVNQITEEAKKFSEIRQSIDFEQNRLKEIHNIQIAADTLTILIQDIEEKRKIFEGEMESKKQEWDREKADHDRGMKEYLEETQKKRKQEEEEYEYSLKLKRRKEENEYSIKIEEQRRVLQQEMNIKEEELVKREQLIVQREQEFDRLKKEVESFPEKLQKANEAIEKETKERTEKEAAINAQLLAKEIEGRSSLYTAQIENLKQTVENQTGQIETLKKQIEQATSKVQELAAKVIDGASNLKTLQTLKEIGLAPNTKEKRES